MVVAFKPAEPCSGADGDIHRHGYSISNEYSDRHGRTSKCGNPGTRPTPG